MCEPGSESTSLPEPTGPTDDRFVYLLTAAGTQALAEQTGKAREKGVRPGTVSYQWQGANKVPSLRLAGDWLRRAGFEVGQRYEVAVVAGRLTIQLVPL